MRAEVTDRRPGATRWPNVILSPSWPNPGSSADEAGYRPAVAPAPKNFGDSLPVLHSPRRGPSRLMPDSRDSEVSTGASAVPPATGSGLTTTGTGTPCPIRRTCYFRSAECHLPLRLPGRSRYARNRGVTWVTDCESPAATTARV
jgi:hypothetical protein